ncbi:hypothetical protein ES702_03569 [subsurface metagenome]
MMKNKKYVLGILAIAILISDIVGYVYCEQEYNTGSEWFQTGNRLPISEFQTKQSKDLADNRIGCGWGGLWQPVDLQAILNNEILGVGLKRVRLNINVGQLDMVNWSYPEFSIDPSHDEWITSIANNGIKITYVLNFWDKAGWAEGRWESWNETGRFKTEEEIQRYLDFVRFIVRHFKDRVQYFEVWNEPNQPELPWGNIELADYINLVQRVVPVIREEYPEAKIVVGSIPEPFDPHFGGPYFFGILRSDIMPLVDAISWHPFYGSSPESIRPFRQEYYYNYSSWIQEIKDVASSHGFKGEYIADEILWLTYEEAGPMPWQDPTQGYSTIDAAKYTGRGIVMNLGMNITVTALVSPDRPRNMIVKNLCTIMAGAEPFNMSSEIESEATNIRNYSFSLPNGDKLVALWTDGVAVDEDPGMKANLTLHGFTGQEVMGIDILEGFQQPIVTSSENGNLAIKDLLIRDYPMILLIYTKLVSSITCSASKLEITEGESITVSGVLSPPLSDKSVTLTYKKPDGSTLNRIVTTSSDGSFSDSYKTDATGSWSVTASWEGDFIYEGAFSSSISFSVKEGECIIATTTYGSELSPEVQFLRGFRDNTVLTTFAGSSFMTVFNEFYYSFSPNVASVIAGNSILKDVMKVILYPLVGILHLSSAAFSVFNFSPELGVVVAGLIASSIIGVVYFLPLALILCLVKKFKVSANIFRSIGLIWVGNIITIFFAEISKSPLLMMISTGAFVLTTISVATLTSLRIILKRLIH